VATLYKVIGGINIVVPEKFKSAEGQFCLKCNYKTHQGWLFPLSKSLIFVNKPVLVIPISAEKVERVELLRVDSSK